MSDKQSKTKAVVEYLQRHKVTDKLNLVVNLLCAARPDDPWGFLANELTKSSRVPAITKLVGREVLDSRGNPTVEVDVYATVLSEEKLIARQGAPSGASTGSHEAMELRDNDQSRYLGKGVSKAAENVTLALSKAVSGLNPVNLVQCDDALRKADGTRLKQKLGGNAITAASFALAEAGALLNGVQLFEHFGAIFHDKTPQNFSMPRPMVNILNGGKHAGGNMKIQEFMIIPAGNIPFKEMLRHVTTVYHHLSKIVVSKHGRSAKNLGDEGGFAPNLFDPAEALELIELSVKNAGLNLGKDIFLALDCAASEFYIEEKKIYELKNDKTLTSQELIDYYVDLKKRFPALISIEDPLHEKDYDAWKKMTAKFATEFKDNVMIVGDDLYTTNTDLITRGIQEKWANSLLLKVNQIGTVAEAMDAARMIFGDNGRVAVSHRSGETCGTIIADLAVGIGAQFIKTGAPARGERVAKYNRLLQIEEYLISKNMLAKND